MEKGKISALQMVMMMYPTIVATAILSVPSITAKFANQDSWLSPIFASLFGFVTVYIACALHKLHPKQTVIQFSEQIIGRIPGKILSFFVLLFYIQSTGQIVRDYSDFIVGSFLFKTPISLVSISMVLLCAIVVYGGLEVLARVSQLFFPIFVFPLLLLLLLLSPDFEIGNIFPILEEGIMPPLKGAVVPGGWFTEFFLIIFFLPYLTDEKNGTKYGMMMVLVVMITLVIVNLAVLLVLGLTTSSKVYPLMIAGRYISFAHFFEQFESIIMAVWILGAFVKISVFFYAATLGTAQWLNLKDYRPIIWPIAILVVEFSVWSLPSTMEMGRYNEKAFPYYGVLIQTVIPLFLLVIATVRKRKKKHKSADLEFRPSK